MANLINKTDKNVVSSAGFIKNAVFYKDMFAFYDAYEKLMQQKPSSLPNFCYKKGTYYLEGICLLFKTYSSELGFESVKLSLDYLKVLYYTIASYSKEGELPDRQILTQEFDVYRKSSIDLAASANVDVKTEKDKFVDIKKDYDKVTNKYAKKLVFSRIFDGLFIFLTIFFVIAAMLPFTFYYLDKIEFNKAVIFSLIVLGVGLAISITFKFLSKKKQTQANDLKFVIQGKKRAKDNAEIEFDKVFDKYNKINSEKYEYNSSFVNEFKKCAKTLSFGDVIKRAKEYKFLSYNIKNDLIKMFESQEKEIRDCISRINMVTNPETASKDFEKLYSRILDADWLYFNNEVRFEFIKQMIDVSEFTYNYTVDYNGKKINPFDISVKNLAKEPIVYLKSEDDLFVSATLDKFLCTKYIKNTKTLELKQIKSSDALKRAKMEFATHFFDYENTIKYNNLFYDTKLQEGVKIPPEIIEENRKVPTFIYMKLKLIEARLGLGNSDAQTIKQIASYINKYETGGDIEKIAVIDIEEEEEFEKEVAIETTTYEDLGYAIKYTFEDGSYIGYRLPTTI